jgi:hypothetical protein
MTRQHGSGVVARSNLSARDHNTRLTELLLDTIHPFNNRKILFMVQQPLKRYIVDNIADIVILSWRLRTSMSATISNKVGSELGNTYKQ